MNMSENRHNNYLGAVWALCHNLWNVPSAIFWRKHNIIKGGVILLKMAMRKLMLHSFYLIFLPLLHFCFFCLHHIETISSVFASSYILALCLCHVCQKYKHTCDVKFGESLYTTHGARGGGGGRPHSGAYQFRHQNAAQYQFQQHDDEKINSDTRWESWWERLQTSYTSMKGLKLWVEFTLGNTFAFPCKHCRAGGFNIEALLNVTLNFRQWKVSCCMLCKFWTLVFLLNMAVESYEYTLIFWCLL